MKTNLELVMNYLRVALPDFKGLSTLPPARGKKATEISIAGVAHTVSEWSKISGIPSHTIRDRYKHGWKPEDIINTPVNGSKMHSDACSSGSGVKLPKTYLLDNNYYTLKQLSDKFKVSKSTLHGRLKVMSPEEAVKKEPSPKSKRYQIEGTSLKNYCKIHNIAYTTIKSYLYKGMSLEDAIKKWTENHK